MVVLTHQQGRGSNEKATISHTKSCSLTSRDGRLLKGIAILVAVSRGVHVVVVASGHWVAAAVDRLLR